MNAVNNNNNNIKTPFPNLSFHFKCKRWTEKGEESGFCHNCKLCVLNSRQSYNIRTRSSQ